MGCVEKEGRKMGGNGGEENRQKEGKQKQGQTEGSIGYVC